MKKLDDMAKQKESEHQVFDAPVNTSITYGCCSELPTIQPVTRRNAVDNEYDDEEHGQSDLQKKRQLFSDKLLIIIGLALTIAIVTWYAGIYVKN